MIFLLIWRNIWRNRRRAVITLASVLFAVLLAVMMKSLQAGVFEHLIKNVVSFHSGYIQVHANGYWNEQTLENSFAISGDVNKKIATAEGVKGLVPRIESFVLASSGNVTRGCLCIGTNAKAEDDLTGIKSRVIRGKYLNDSSSDALIAEGLAQKVRLNVGDTIVLLTQGYHGMQAAGKFAIAGIVKFASPQLNDAFVFLPLRTAQEFLRGDSILTSIALAVSPNADLESIQQSLQASLGKNYEVMTWQELMPDIASHIKADGTFYNILIGILYLVIAFGIFGTTLMMMNERAHELAMLLSIGMKRRFIALMLLGETVLLSLLGALAGAIIAFPVVWYFAAHPIRMGGNMGEVFERFGFEAVIPTVIHTNIFLTQAFVVFIVALVIGIYPLIRTRRLTTLNAMKR